MRRGGTALFAMVALVACGGDDSPPPSYEERFVPASPARKLDLLFVIINSVSTAESQARLAESFPLALEALRDVDGELPDLHIGVVTTDLGTTGSDDPANPAPPFGSLGNGGCAGAGDDGVLKTYGASVEGSYLVDSPDGAGGRARNYEGELTDRVSNLVRGVGSTGCAYEQPFAVIRRALTNPANAGFLREDAHLAVVIAGEEDDCSVRDPAFFTFDPTTSPMTPYRCMAQAVECNEPFDTVGTKTGCRAREDSPSIEGIAETEAFLRSLKSDPSLVSVAALTGPTSPVEVAEHAAPGGQSTVLGLKPACTFADVHGGDLALPAIRIAELVSRFGGNGHFAVSCSADESDNLRQLGRLWKQPLGVTCLDTTRLRDSDSAPGIQPTCRLADISGTTETPIPACPTDGTCFEIVADAAACPETSDHLRLVVNRTASPPAGAHVRIRCDLR